MILSKEKRERGCERERWKRIVLSFVFLCVHVFVRDVKERKRKNEHDYHYYYSFSRLVMCVALSSFINQSRKS